MRTKVMDIIPSSNQVIIKLISPLSATKNRKEKEKEKIKGLFFFPSMRNAG